MLYSYFRPLVQWRRRIAFPYEKYMVRHKCIFIHIPKAAGTSLRAALGGSSTGRLHLPWWVYRKADPLRFETYFKFAFVRHPVDRAVSAYNYIASGGNRKGDLSLASRISRYASFSEFIREEMTQGDILAHPLFWTQASYLLDYEGRVMVDFLGRMENINADYGVVSKKLGIGGGLVHSNKSMDKAYSGVDSDAFELIYRIYRKDFEAFRYS